jgi:GDPmannose 4,6-dehydratase
MRPADVFSLRGDSLKARTELGWSPRVHLPELVEMMVYFDMKRLEGQVGK